MKRPYLLLCLLAILGCASDDRQPDCSLVLPPPNWFAIGFVDQVGNPLIGTLFTQDSFKLEGAGKVLYLRTVPFGNGETLLVPFTDIQNGATYMLELDADNTERLRVDFETREATCGNNYNISALYYNGELFSEEDEEVYLLPKQIDP